MFLLRWPGGCLLLAYFTPAWSLETLGHDVPEVTCSQGLSGCTVQDELPISISGSRALDVQNLNARFGVCCRDGAECSLCLAVDAELRIPPGDEPETGLHHIREHGENSQASVTVCYQFPLALAACKRWKFTINRTDIVHDRAQVSMVIRELDVSFGSQVLVYPSWSPHQAKEILAPSLTDVCSHRLLKHVKDCGAPSFNVTIRKAASQVELQFSGESKNSLCVKYEQNGKCQRWNSTTIPLHAVAPCMCLLIWEDDRSPWHSQICPFMKTDEKHDRVQGGKLDSGTTDVDLSEFQRNMWENLSVSVDLGQMNNGDTALQWSLSSPCRLEGEVWPCQRTASRGSCLEIEGHRRSLANSTWVQNSNGRWVRSGTFEDVDVRLASCVMVKLEGMDHELVPFCAANTDRCHWTLLVVALILLVVVTMLLVCLPQDFVKKWVQNCHQRGFVKMVRKGHVVLLSPPDVDDGVSESVSQLGYQLRGQGFSVSVDQWSRKEQYSLGPLPWLHAQILELNSRGGRVVLVLTRTAAGRIERWDKGAVWTKGEDKDLHHTWSPYADMFIASLGLIRADKQSGRAAERFLLVKFDSHIGHQPGGDWAPPELLQGLPLFRLPSQKDKLLSELTMGGKRKGWDGRPSTGWKWRTRKGEGPCTCI